METLGDFVCTKYNYMLPKLVTQKETGEYMLEMSKQPMTLTPEEVQLPTVTSAMLQTVAPTGGSY